ncbi:MlaA family lipoprotein [Paracoccus jiaweipingae]|uniref:MlaA family lipoprotein n=1 Tax=unclassified Paracoccus (in: a-proteobacteria) TaxID=2688777 RepID=UPI0037A19426
MQPLNRRIHAFNVGLDKHVLRPVARPFKGGGDGGGEPGVLVVAGNVSANLSLPGKVVNHLLQGRPGPALRNSLRFAVNTTLGLGGIMDPAGQEFALAEQDTDFGETLHVWGVPEGAYIELPLLGPSTLRDAAGKVVDVALDPLSPHLNPDQKRGKLALKVLSKAGKRARFGDTVDSILHDSADSYAQARLMYLQHRRHELGQDSQEIDPYDDPYAP